MIRILLIFFGLTTVINAQTMQFDVRGNWVGELQVGAKIQLIFKVSGEFVITGSMDVPLQGAKDIPIIVSETIESVQFKVEPINGRFEGKKIDSITLEGSWKQNGGIYPLTLRKKDITIESPKRPQTPKEPFPYLIEEIVAKGPAGKLGGTLTKPNGKGPFPLVICITGSGAQDRDETIFNHKPFFVLADALTRNGIAVLRMDDRGVGSSEGNPALSTSLDFAQDIQACINTMKHKEGVDANRIGLLGHSEGGIIAQILAAQNPSDIAFVCSMAGIGITGMDLLIWQTRKVTSKTLPMGEVEKSVRRQKTILTMIKESKDSLALRILLTDSLGTWAVEQQKMFMVNSPEFRAQLNQLQSPWLRFFIGYDPAEYLPKVKCPIFAINGSEDMQVESQTNLQQIENLLKSGGNRSVKIKEYQGMNHLFQKCATCDVEEYAKIETTIEQEVIDDIISWLKDTTKNKPSKKQIKRR